ncbi:tetratricopeptide repeat protein [Flavobacterium sp.]|uniref:ATP-binding protein n=1 Tax=Flavobacterium sp. TaxID=239 RepID=UPI00391B73B2
MNNGFRFLLLLLIVLYGCNPKATDKNTSPTNDSIQKYLALAGNDTLPFDKRTKYNDKALSFVDLERNDSLTREYLSGISKINLNTNQTTKFEIISKIHFRKSEIAKDTLRIAKYYENKGYYFKKLYVYDSAIYYYLKAEQLYLKIKDKNNLAIVYNKKALVQLYLDDYLGAELSAKKSYNYLKKTKYHYKIVICLLTLGNSYHNMKEYKKAILTFQEALYIIKKHNIYNRKNNFSAGTCLNNIGNALREQKKFDEAIYYFKKALKEKNIKDDDSELYGYLLNNLGYCYLKTNKNLNLSFQFKEAKKIFDALGLKNESAVSDIYLSEYFIKKGDTAKANAHAESALKLSKEADAPYYYLTALTHAGSINPKKAPVYIKEYHRINDSLLFAERTARNQYYKIQLETDEISEQKQEALKQRSIVMALAFTLFLISILIFIIARQRLKQKEFRLQQTEQRANEEIYQLMLSHETKEEKARQKEKKRIGLELHDGIMNKLVSTRLNLSILSISRDEATVKKCLGYIKDIQNIEKEIRNVAHDLNQEVLLDSNSFSKLLQGLIKDHNKTSRTIFKMEVEADIDWNIISNNKKMNLYRIIQEATHNINKHAKAKKATIKITLEATNISLSITDDGIGFAASSSENGIGLKNMKYRVKLLKGKFKIHSKSDSGTSINITIPLKEH